MYPKAAINCCCIIALVAVENGYTRQTYRNFLATRFASPLKYMGMP